MEKTAKQIYDNCFNTVLKLKQNDPEIDFMEKFNELIICNCKYQYTFNVYNPIGSLEEFGKNVKACSICDKIISFEKKN
jgi:hypothetical protein